MPDDRKVYHITINDHTTWCRYPYYVDACKMPINWELEMGTLVCSIFGIKRAKQQAAKIHLYFGYRVTLAEGPCPNS